MVRRGTVDFKELQQLQERFEKLNQKEADKILGELAKEKVKYFLGSVIRLTPVGQYNDGKVGGTLRKSWTTKTQREAELTTAFGGREDIDGHIKRNLKVKRNGKTYSIDVANNTEYASYVNYGRRNRGGNGFVNGQFFLEQALSQTENNSKKILDRKLVKLLREVVEGD